MACSNITIIDVPSDIGSMIKGKHLAPGAFKSANLNQKLSDIGYKVHERNTLPDGPRTWRLDSSTEPTGARNEEENIEVNHLVKDIVKGSIGDDISAAPFQFIVGGECNIVPAIMSAFGTALRQSE